MEIKSGVPKPERAAGGPKKYPFEKMKIGDCFEYSVLPNEDHCVMQRSIHSTARQRGYRVSTRHKNGKITVWLEGIYGKTRTK